MKQILQNLHNGKTGIYDVPYPSNSENHLIVETQSSLISPGTEKMLLDFSKSGYLGKIKKQPDKVKEVIQKIKTDGFLATVDAVNSKLNSLIPLGYCNAGVVKESLCSEFSVGDRVISNGAHAEIVKVPKNLCAKIPENIDCEKACFTVIGGIALQSVRLLNPTIGESICVYGLGLVGLLCVQILKANGCKVIGIDFDKERVKLAKEFGAETVDLSKNQDPVLNSNNFTNNIGLDGVIIASSSNDNEVIHKSALMCRQRGRIVLVGVTGLKLRRDDFFKKEISFQVSSSYGPGRYDRNYEEMGQDYPLGFVRWTAKRNFEAFLELMKNGTVNVEKLISEKFTIENIQPAYKRLSENPSLGLIISYPAGSKKLKEKKEIFFHNKKSLKNFPEIGFIGAGNYASRTLIPSLIKTNANRNTLFTMNGVSGSQYGKKFNFKKSSTDLNSLWSDKTINTVIIATRHNSHAELVCKALKSGKNVFVEKPLALNLEELKSISSTYQKINKTEKTNLKLMVGFNRRFSPLSIKMKELINFSNKPKHIVITINAGFIEETHWVQNAKIGGGRFIGEACHFVDFLRYLIGSKINNFKVMKIDMNSSKKHISDIVTVTIRFEDGSLGTIHYLSNGSKSFPKERVEVFCDGAILKLTNFLKLEGYDWPNFRSKRFFRQNKGNDKCIEEFINCIKDGEKSPIPFDEILEVSKTTINISNELIL